MDAGVGGWVGGIPRVMAGGRGLGDVGVGMRDGNGKEREREKRVAGREGKWYSIKHIRVKKKKS